MFKFKDDKYFISLLGSAPQFGIPSWELRRWRVGGGEENCHTDQGIGQDLCSQLATDLAVVYPFSSPCDSNVHCCTYNILEVVKVVYRCIALSNNTDITNTGQTVLSVTSYHHVRVPGFHFAPVSLFTSITS